MEKKLFNINQITDQTCFDLHYFTNEYPLYCECFIYFNNKK